MEITATCNIGEGLRNKGTGKRGAYQDAQHGNHGNLQHWRRTAQQRNRKTRSVPRCATWKSRQLATLEKDCATKEQENAERTKMRNMEITATCNIGEGLRNKGTGKRGAYQDAQHGNH